MWCRFDGNVWPCNNHCVVLNYYDLGLLQVGLKSFVISMDYRDYMGSSLETWLLVDCFYTWTLIIWSVLWQGPKYHGADIPKDYYRVEVSTVVQGYEDEILDIPSPEDIVKLGRTINNFILWHRRDVQLKEPPPPSQEMPLTQESSAHVDPLPNPPPSPPQSLPNPPESPLNVFPVHQPSPLHDLCWVF